MDQEIFRYQKIKWPAEKWKKIGKGRQKKTQRKGGNRAEALESDSKCTNYWELFRM